MARFWFVSAPLLSHLDWGGFLRTAVQLHKDGHEVLWISGEPVRAVLEANGIPFVAIAETGWQSTAPPPLDLTTLTPPQAMFLRYQRGLDVWMSVERVTFATQALLDLTLDHPKPDVIVTDPYLTTTALVAEIFAVPLVVVGYPALAKPNDEVLYPIQQIQSDESRTRLQQLFRHFGIQGMNFSDGATPSLLSPSLHLNYFTKEWYWAEQLALLDQNVFVGGTPERATPPNPAWLDAISNDMPLGFITLGLSYTGELGFFAWAAHAVARAGMIPIVVIGNQPIAPDKKQELVRALPKTARLLNGVNLAQVLPRTQLAIHHGGLGVTHALLLRGILQMVVPHSTEQRLHAKRVATAKVGLNLSAIDVRRGKLAEGTLALVQDQRVQQTAQAFAESMIDAGGVATATQHLLRIADAR